MANEGLIWIAVRRRKQRVHYHEPVQELTICGQLMGEIDNNGNPLRGWLMEAERATRLYGAKPCSKCYGKKEQA